MSPVTKARTVVATALLMMVASRALADEESGSAAPDPFTATSISGATFGVSAGVFHASSVTALSPGLRYGLPVDGRFRPWLGAHGGVDHVTLTSGDSTTGSTYWSIDGAAGLDVMVTHGLSFGVGADFCHANVLNPPRSQPVPAGSVAVREPSDAIDWITLRAGFGLVL